MFNEIDVECSYFNGTGRFSEHWLSCVITSRNMTHGNCSNRSWYRSRPPELRRLNRPSPTRRTSYDLLMKAWVGISSLLCYFSHWNWILKILLTDLFFATGGRAIPT